MFKRIISSLVCLTFSFSNLQYVYAQDFSVNQLPIPGTMVGISTPFAPLALKGLIVNTQKPLEFQFIVDTGKGPQDTASVKDQANQLVKYFLAGLTIPEGDLWVNLSPYEKNRMVPEALGQTDLGRDLLAQDYILKQLTASLIYPEKDLGKEFWSRVYAKAQAQFGTTNVPVNTFNKVWILPDQAQVYENVNAAYVTKSTLKVMLDEDYTALQKHVTIHNGTDSIGSQIVRQIILPEITKEVNTGKNFAPLRQIYQALILAKWYKETIQNGLLDAVYTNKNKVAGVNVNDPTAKEQIYERYLKAYKKGAFNYIKEDPTPDGQVVPRKYFSGGLELMPRKLRRDGDGAMISKKGWVAGILLLVAVGLGVAIYNSNSNNTTQSQPTNNQPIQDKTSSVEKTRRVTSYSVKADDNEQNFSLIRAASEGDIKTIKKLLEQGGNINAMTSNGSALMVASGRGLGDTVAFLLANGADINEVNEGDGASALIFACESANDMILQKQAKILVVKMLLENGADIKVRTGNGLTALMWASRGGSPEVVEQLIANGADVNVKVGNLTALSIALQEIQTGQQQAIVKMLKEHGAKDNAMFHTPIQNKTPDAAMFINAKIAFWTLRGNVVLIANKLNDANIRVRRSAIRAINWYVTNSQMKHDIVRIAFEKGNTYSDIHSWAAKLLGVPTYDRLLFDTWNWQRGKNTFTMFPRKVENYNLVNEKTGQTFLMYLAEVGNTRFVRKAIEQGTEINAKDKNGNTALSLALKNEHWRTVDTLRYNGANDPNITTPNQTPKQDAAMIRGFKLRWILNHNRGEVLKSKLDDFFTNENSTGDILWAFNELAVILRKNQDKEKILSAADLINFTTNSYPGPQYAHQAFEELATNADLQFRIGLIGLKSKDRDTVIWAMKMLTKSNNISAIELILEVLSHKSYMDRIGFSREGFELVMSFVGMSGETNKGPEYIQLIRHFIKMKRGSKSLKTLSEEANIALRVLGADKQVIRKENENALTLLGQRLGDYVMAKENGDYGAADQAYDCIEYNYLSDLLWQERDLSGKYRYVFVPATKKYVPYSESWGGSNEFDDKHPRVYPAHFADDVPGHWVKIDRTTGNVVERKDAAMLGPINFIKLQKLKKEYGEENADVLRMLLKRQPRDAKGSLLNYVWEAIRYKLDGYDFKVVFEPEESHEESIPSMIGLADQLEKIIDKSEVLKIERGELLDHAMSTPNQTPTKTDAAMSTQEAMETIYLSRMSHLPPGEDVRNAVMVIVNSKDTQLIQKAIRFLSIMAEEEFKEFTNYGFNHDRSEEEVERDRQIVARRVVFGKDMLEILRKTLPPSTPSIEQPPPDASMSTEVKELVNEIYITTAKNISVDGNLLTNPVFRGASAAEELVGLAKARAIRTQDVPGVINAFFYGIRITGRKKLEKIQDYENEYYNKINDFSFQGLNALAQNGVIPAKVIPIVIDLFTKELTEPGIKFSAPRVIELSKANGFHFVIPSNYLKLLIRLMFDSKMYQYGDPGIEPFYIPEALRMFLKAGLIKQKDVPIVVGAFINVLISGGQNSVECASGLKDLVESGAIEPDKIFKSLSVKSAVQGAYNGNLMLQMKLRKALNFLLKKEEFFGNRFDRFESLLILIKAKLISPKDVPRILAAFKDELNSNIPYAVERARNGLMLLGVNPDMLLLPAHEDKATISNGGIDLNQINVLRHGKTVNVQFDPAQLNSLEQGGFGGFSFKIESMTRIASPFQLLGINVPKKQMILAKA